MRASITHARIAFQLLCRALCKTQAKWDARKKGYHVGTWTLERASGGVRVVEFVASDRGGRFGTCEHHPLGGRVLSFGEFVQSVHFVLDVLRVLLGHPDADAVNLFRRRMGKRPTTGTIAIRRIFLERKRDEFTTALHQLRVACEVAEQYEHERAEERV